MPNELSDSLIVNTLHTDRCLNLFCEDSLYFYPQTFASINTPANSSSEIFGSNALINNQITTISQPNAIIANNSHNTIILDSLLLVLFFFYVIIIYIFRDASAFLFKILTNKAHLDTITEEHSLLFRYFVNITNFMGYIAMLALLIKLYNINFTDENVIHNYVSLLLLGAVSSLFVYRLIIHTLIAKISLNAEFIQNITFFNRIIFAGITIIGTPLVMSIEFLGSEDKILLFNTTLIALTIFILYYIIKSYRFFIDRKISILQWFLYLCAVEILPISFYGFIVIRNFNF